MTEGNSGNGNNAGAGKAGPGASTGGADTGGASTGVPPPSQNSGGAADAAGNLQGNGTSADGNGELNSGGAPAVVEADAAQTAENSAKPQEAKGGGGFAIFYQDANGDNSIWKIGLWVLLVLLIIGLLVWVATKFMKSDESK